jgi:hypothetical protein
MRRSLREATWNVVNCGEWIFLGLYPGWSPAMRARPGATFLSPSGAFDWVAREDARTDLSDSVRVCPTESDLFFLLGWSDENRLKAELQAGGIGRIILNQTTFTVWMTASCGTW